MQKHHLEQNFGLSMVLLGKTGAGKSATGNTILGRQAFISKKSPKSVTQDVAVASGGVCGIQITVYDTQGFCYTELSEDNIQQKFQSILQECESGPCVYLLVIKPDRFTAEEQNTVKKIEKLLGQHRLQKTWILFTRGDELEDENMTIEDFIKDTEPLKKLIQKYDGRYHLFNNKKKTSGQVGMLVGKLLNELGKLVSDLSIVLCGTYAGLKVNFSELLRGKKTLHQQEFSSVCVKKVEKIHGHQISVVELPSLTQLSEDKAMHESLHCLSLCNPGVHVFIFIVPVGPLTDEDKAEVEKIQKIFYSSEHFMVIFTTDVTVDKNLRDFVESYSECKNLTSVCGGRYRVIGLKEHEKSKQIPELLDYIKDMKTEPYTLQMYVRAQEKRVRDETKKEYEEKLSEMTRKIKKLQLKINLYGIKDEQEDLEHLRIVLIGKIGNGKSATGNTILGREQFQRGLGLYFLETRVCERGVGEVDGRSVTVVDTPGLLNTALSYGRLQEETIKCVSLSAPGPHAFIIVLSLGRFTRPNSDTIDLMKKFFGPKVSQFSIILFTGGDNLVGKSIEDYVRESADLKKLIRDCGDRYLVFNNNETQDRTQVTKLIKMIEEMKTTNHGQYFTFNSMFEGRDEPELKNILGCAIM